MPFVKRTVNIPRLFGKAFLIGAAVEVSAIIGGIYFIRKCNSDEEFRKQLDHDYPNAMSMFNDTCAIYKRVVEENLSPALQAKIQSFLSSTPAEQKKERQMNWFR